MRTKIASAVAALTALAGLCLAGVPAGATVNPHDPWCPSDADGCSGFKVKTGHDQANGFYENTDSVFYNHGDHLHNYYTNFAYDASGVTGYQSIDKIRIRTFKGRCDNGTNHPNFPDQCGGNLTLVDDTTWTDNWGTADKNNRDFANHFTINGGEGYQVIDYYYTTTGHFSIPWHGQEENALGYIAPNP
jgi:hypothetical protein